MRIGSEEGGPPCKAARHGIWVGQADGRILPRHYSSVALSIMGIINSGSRRFVLRAVTRAVTHAHTHASQQPIRRALSRVHVDPQLVAIPARLCPLAARSEAFGRLAVCSPVPCFPLSPARHTRLSTPNNYYERLLTLSVLKILQVFASNPLTYSKPRAIIGYDYGIQFAEP
jgi:hypothetical protein